MYGSSRLKEHIKLTTTIKISITNHTNFPENLAVVLYFHLKIFKVHSHASKLYFVPPAKLYFVLFAGWPKDPQTIYLTTVLIGIVGSILLWLRNISKYIKCLLCTGWGERKTCFTCGMLCFRFPLRLKKFKAV